ncbi:hypothetical protein [Gracilimonas tropica]|nr:hypothetical protein [Gracilimonas tropica]
MSSRPKWKERKRLKCSGDLRILTRAGSRATNGINANTVDILTPVDMTKR